MANVLSNGGMMKKRPSKIYSPGYGVHATALDGDSIILRERYPKSGGHPTESTPAVSRTEIRVGPSYDAPEWNKPGGQVAKKKLQSVLDTHISPNTQRIHSRVNQRSDVHFEWPKKGDKKDHYGRHLMNVFIPSTNNPRASTLLTKNLIQKGYGNFRRYPGADYTYDRLLNSVQKTRGK